MTFDYHKEVKVDNKLRKILWLIFNLFQYAFIFSFYNKLSCFLYTTTKKDHLTDWQKKIPKTFEYY